MATRAQKLRQQAQRLESRGDLRGARAAYRGVLDEFPSDLSARQRVAELALQLGDVAESVAERQVIARQFALDGFLFKAIAIAKDILRIAPEHTETQVLLAELYARPRIARAPRGSGEAEPALGATEGASPVRGWLRGGGPRPATPRIPHSAPLFSDLPRNAFLAFMEGLEARRFAGGDVIIAEGERGHSFFLLVSGRVRVEKLSGGAPIVLATLEEGAFFGEMALLDDAPRSASVIAEDEVEVLEVERGRLDALTARHPSAGKALRRFYEARLLATSIATHPFFRPFLPHEQRKLVGLFRARTMAEGEVLIRPGARGEGLFLLLSGRFVVRDPGGSPLAELGPGAIVGEMSLLAEQPTRAEVRARTQGWVLRLAPEDFREITQARPELVGLLADLMTERTRKSRPADDVLV